MNGEISFDLYFFWCRNESVFVFVLSGPLRISQEPDPLYFERIYAVD